MICINMKTTDLLLFLTNLMTVSSFVTHQERLSPGASHDVVVSEGRNECSLFTQNRNIVDYTINCKNVTLGNGKIIEDFVVARVCDIVKNIILYLCKKKLEPATLNFDVGNALVCPFNLSLLVQLGIVDENTSSVARILTDKELCPRVCYDVKDPKIQCVILSTFNNYLESRHRENVPADLSPNQAADVQRSKQPAETPQKTELSNSSFKVQPGKENLMASENTETAIKAKTVSLPNNKASGEIQNKSSQKEKAASIASGIKSTAAEELRSTEKTETTKMEKEPSTSDYDSLNGGQDFKEDEIQPPLQSNMNQDSFEEEKKMSLAVSMQEGKFPDRSEIYSGEGFFQAEESHFFVYFLMVSSVIIIGYLAFHNKNKILAYALEGSSGRRSKRRPNPARYRKLESNLEEAISSNSSNAASSSVVY